MPDTVPPPAAPADPDLLSERQRLFCLLYARGGNGRAAAEGAGYSPRTARQQASRLLTYADIRETVADLRAEAQEQNGIERAELIARLDYVYLRAMTRGEYHPAIRAVEAQAKLSGLLPARLTLAEARLIARAQAELAAEATSEAANAAEPEPAAAPVPDADPAPQDAAAPTPAPPERPAAATAGDAPVPAAAPPSPAVASDVLDGRDPRAPDESPAGGASRPAGDLRGWGPYMTDGKGGIVRFNYSGPVPCMAAAAPAPAGQSSANAGRTPEAEPFVPTPAQRKAAASALAWAGRTPASASSAASAAIRLRETAGEPLVPTAVRVETAG